MKRNLLYVAVAGALSAAVDLYERAAAASRGFLAPLALHAVVNTKSTLVTNLDATPRVMNSPIVQEGRLQVSIGVVAAANGDSIGSTYRFARLSTSDRVDSILLDNDVVATGAMDVGIYDTAENGGAAIDADLFASAQALTAALRATDITRESGVITVANMGKRLWELLGLTSDPRKLVDVVGTLTAAATGAGNVALTVRSVKGN